MALPGIKRIDDCLESILIGSQIERVVSMEGIVGTPSNLRMNGDGELEQIILPDLRDIIDFHAANPRVIIRGICRMIASGVGGVLSAEGLVVEEQIYVETVAGHSLLQARSAQDGEEIVIDMGGQQAFPRAIPVGGGVVACDFYETRKSSLGSNTLYGQAYREEDGIHFTINDPANSYTAHRVYAPAPVTDPSALWRGIQKSFGRKGTYFWRYGPGGSERTREPFLPVDKYVVDHISEENAPFLIQNSGGGYGEDAPLGVRISERKLLDIVEACHEADRIYHIARGDRDMLFHEQPPERVLERRRSVLWVASGQADSPRAHHACYLREKRRSGWTWGPTRDNEARRGPYVTDWDDPKLPKDAHSRNTKVYQLIRERLQNS